MDYFCSLYLKMKLLTRSLSAKGPHMTGAWAIITPGYAISFSRACRYSESTDHCIKFLTSDWHISTLPQALFKHHITPHTHTHCHKYSYALLPVLPLLSHKPCPSSKVLFRLYLLDIPSLFTLALRYFSTSDLLYLFYSSLLIFTSHVYIYLAPPGRIHFFMMKDCSLNCFCTSHST